MDLGQFNGFRAGRWIWRWPTDVARDPLSRSAGPGDELGVVVRRVDPDACPLDHFNPDRLPHLQDAELFELFGKF